MPSVRSHCMLYQFIIFHDYNGAIEEKPEKVLY
jgi:hypothetical protein